LRNGFSLKGKHNDEVRVAEELNYLLKPVNSSVISSIKTITPVMKSTDIKVNANGIITYDTRAFATISSRLEGRIERHLSNIIFSRFAKAKNFRNL